MRVPTLLLWLILLLLSAALVCSSALSHASCLQPTWRSDNFSARAQVERAQSGAHLSPVVFLGTLRSVLVQRDGTVRAWFAVDTPLKRNVSTTRKRHVVSHGGWNTPSIWWPRARHLDQEVVYSRTGSCVLSLNQDNLKLGTQYLVFGALGGARTLALAATALPIPNDKRTLRAVRRIVCKGCAKPPSIAGLINVRVTEGGRTQLHCHMAGNPIPWVEWYKDGTRITATRGRLRVRTRRRTSRLVVRRARASDRGVYECRAGNVVQREPVSATATLIVTRKPRRRTTPRPRPRTTSASTAFSLWTIEPCPISDFCLNGGTCTFYKDVREYVCHCAEGFIGLRCDFKDVSISVAETKGLTLYQNRLFIAVVVLFLVLFCLHWAALAATGSYCFRSRRSSWRSIRKVEPLRMFFNRKLGQGGDSSMEKVVEPREALDRDNSDEGFASRTAIESGGSKRSRPATPPTCWDDSSVGEDSAQKGCFESTK